MAICWVNAGSCGQETSIEAHKIGQTKAGLEFTTTCQYVSALAEELTELDIGSEVTKPLNETLTYTLAAKHMCRTSCVVPAAILKMVELTGGIFPADSCAIEFLDTAV